MSSWKSISLDDAIARLDSLLARRAEADPAPRVLAPPSKVPAEIPADFPEPTPAAEVQAYDVVDGAQRSSGFAGNNDVALLQQEMRLIRDDLERVWQAIQASDLRSASETIARKLATLQQSVDDAVLPQGRELLRMLESSEFHTADQRGRWPVVRTVLALLVGVGVGFAAAMLTYPSIHPWLSTMLALNL